MKFNSKSPKNHFSIFLILLLFFPFSTAQGFVNGFSTNQRVEVKQSFITNPIDIDTTMILSILANAGSDGRLMVFEHNMGEWHARDAAYLVRKNYEFSEIEFIENAMGDFNKNNTPDICAYINIKHKHRHETYICFLELDEAGVKVYSYLEMVAYLDLIVEETKNDTLHIRTTMYDLAYSPIFDRKLEVVHDSAEVLRIVTPSRIDDMQNKNIFKPELQHVERKSYVSNEIISAQYEVYNKNNIKITAELKGFNDFTLRFTIVSSNIPQADFDKADYINELFEWLESNTRFASLLTKIERDILIKNEDGVEISDKMRYNTKNYLSDNAYFMIGEHLAHGTYLFDLIFYEEAPN